tara:strand:+ start:2598 stop:3230 length:633 start_codon:yes stop_codon:yes gene_type:complete
VSEIYKFTSFTTSNCYILRPFNDDVCFFIDLPPDLEEPLEYVKNNNLTIGGALVTHGHFDHALGMQKFNGNIHMNLNDDFLARNPQEQLAMFTNTTQDVEMFNGEIQDVEQSEFDFLNVYHNPGHTAGSSSFEFPELGLIFTGDFVFKDSVGRTDLKTGSHNEMISSIKNVYSLFNNDYEVMPGHGPSEKVSIISKNNSFIKDTLNGRTS